MIDIDETGFNLELKTQKIQPKGDVMLEGNIKGEGGASLNTGISGDTANPLEHHKVYTEDSNDLWCPFSFSDDSNEWLGANCRGTFFCFTLASNHSISYRVLVITLFSGLLIGHVMEFLSKYPMHSCETSSGQ
ncbi:hypothetical protein ACHAWF_018042 [Thalassiosira exigua]